MQRLLVVEDEAKLLKSLERGLVEQGYEVATAATGEEGYYIATTQAFDAIVLDVMLPRRGGIQVLQDLRSSGFAAPVLILTARDAIEDKVRGLDAGADDYVVKPFAFAELVARLRALLRRNSIARQLVFKADDLELDVVGRRVVRAGEEIDLSAREFDLLEYLLRHANSTVTRDMIARDIWKESAGVLTNVIDVYIRSLRKKVERPELRQLIHTIRGVGYALRYS
jgi:two-component system copper resistance phosphate regulon response regulator CusR